MNRDTGGFPAILNFNNHEGEGKYFKCSDVKTFMATVFINSLPQKLHFRRFYNGSQNQNLLGLQDYFLAHKSNFKNEEHKYKVYTIMNLFVNSTKIFYQLDICINVLYCTDVSFIITA